MKRKHKYFVLLLYLLAFSYLPAQSTWQKKTGDFAGRWVVNTDKEGNIWAGGSDSTLATLYKITPSGEVIWNRVLCPPDTTLYYSLVGIKPRRDGGVWCVIQVRRGYQTWIYHLDPDGAVIWAGEVPYRYFYRFIYDASWHITLDHEDNCYLLEEDEYGWYNFSRDRMELLMIEANTHIVHQTDIHIPIPLFSQYRGILQDTGPPVLYFDYQRGTNEDERVTYLLGLTPDRQFQWAKRYDNLPINQLQARFSNQDIMAAGGTKSGYYLFRFDPYGTLISLNKAIIHRPDSYFRGHTELCADKKEIWLYGTIDDAPLLSWKSWGTMVYSTSDPEPPRWDGTMNGKLLPPGVYAVVTALRYPGAQEKIEHRTVTLIR